MQVWYILFQDLEFVQHPNAPEDNNWKLQVVRKISETFVHFVWKPSTGESVSRDSYDFVTKIAWLSSPNKTGSKQENNICMYRNLTIIL